MGTIETGPRRDDAANAPAPPASSAPGVIETVVNPFHCLIADAIALHGLSRLRLRESPAESSRLARASLLLYLAAAEALVHQAAAELGRPELAPLVNDPSRRVSPADAWALLPAIVSGGHAPGFDPESPPWPQFAELLAVRESWTNPGPPETRRAYYLADDRGGFEPLSKAREAPPSLGLSDDQLIFPRTGLPRDPYALRPEHLDTARSILQAAIDALDRRLAGALTADRRHHREQTRVAWPPGT